MIAYVGENRGKLYVALRDEFGFTAGFVAVENPKFPKQLLKNEQGGETQAGLSGPLFIFSSFFSATEAAKPLA